MLRSALLALSLFLVMKFCFAQPIMMDGYELPQGYYLVDRNGKFIDLDNEVYADIDEFRNGLARVKQYKPQTYILRGVAFINRSGKRVSDFYESVAAPFSNNRAVVKNKKGKLFLLDNTGKELKSLPYRGCYGEFSEGLLVVFDEQFNFGYIDTTGTEVMPLNFKRAMPFKQGMAFVIPKNGSGQFIDKKQNKLFDAPFEWCTPFESGIAVVSYDSAGKNWNTLINRQGKRLIKPFVRTTEGTQFEAVIYKGFAAYYDAEKKVNRLVDSTGREVPESAGFWDGPREKKPDYAAEGMFPLVSKVGKYNYYGYADSSGKVIVPPVFYEVYPFKDGIGIVYHYDRELADQISEKHRKMRMAEYPGYNAGTDCGTCMGQGFITLSTDCSSCGGKGYSSKRTYNAFDKTVDVKSHSDGSQTIYYIPGGSSSYESGGCQKCHGSGKDILSCSGCKGTGKK